MILIVYIITLEPITHNKTIISQDKEIKGKKQTNQNPKKQKAKENKKRKQINK